MDRISAFGYAIDGNGRRIFADRNTAAGVSGTDVNAAWLNPLQEELVSGLIEATGIVPSAGSTTQVRQAIAYMIGVAVSAAEAALSAQILAAVAAAEAQAQAEVATCLPLAGGHVTGAVQIDGVLTAVGNLNVGNAIAATGNVRGANFETAGDVYSSNHVLTGPTDGNFTPCQSAATGASVSGGQINAYNQAGSSGQFGTAAAGDLVDFWVGNVGTISIQGKITTTGTGVVYGTTSDYRIKQDVQPLTGALDRVAQLTARRFAFKAAPETVVDGFLAHEAQAVVPQAVSGAKDAVDEHDAVLPQTMDASALVPVLWAAVGELRNLVEGQAAQIAALSAAAKPAGA